MSEGNKRRRSESKNQDGGPHQEILELLMSKLHLDEDDDNDSALENQKPFREEIRQITHDKHLIKALQKSLGELMKRVDKKEVDTHQHSSIFNSHLDQAVRDRIVSYLDEEGLWVLEESTMMQLDEEQMMQKWKLLWENRKHSFPDMIGGDGDEEEDEDESEDEDGDAREVARFKRERWKEYGVLFAKASRMARCMEELAQDHYETNFPLPAKVKGHQNSFQWPTSTCNTLRVDRMDNSFFVRIAYQYDSDRSPLVLEGFVDIPYDWAIREEAGRSQGILEFSNVEEEVSELLYRELNQVYNQYDEEDAFQLAQMNQELVTAKRRMGDRMSITVLEVGNTIDRDNQEISLVVSTTGFSNEDGEYVCLTPRSPNFQDQGYAVDNCIRVGFALEEDGQSLKIQLTG